MILWLLITMSAGAAVDVPELICVHDVANRGPSLAPIYHLAPGIADVTHVAPRLDHIAHEDC